AVLMQRLDQLWFPMKHLQHMLRRKLGGLVFWHDVNHRFSAARTAVRQRRLDELRQGGVEVDSDDEAILCAGGAVEAVREAAVLDEAEVAAMEEAAAAEEAAAEAERVAAAAAAAGASALPPPPPLPTLPQPSPLALRVGAASGGAGGAGGGAGGAGGGAGALGARAGSFVVRGPGGDGVLAGSQLPMQWPPVAAMPPTPARRPRGSVHVLLPGQALGQ
ncbi:MAG: hypothetical protein ACK40L_19515, partial [Hydrogenophaga sp.]